MAFKPFKILKGLLIKEENTNSPKQIEITPGGTSNTKTTILSSQTTDKTLTLPDATDTLVGKATTDVLTNKSIDADTNTITNIENADIKAAAGIDASKIADGSVDNTEFQQINGLTSPAVGTTQSQTLTNKTISGSSNTISNVSYSSLILTNSIVNADVATGANIDASKLGTGVVDNTEFNYLNGVTSSIQTQLNDKLNLTGGTLSGALDMGGNKITSLGTPTVNTDAATKLYADNLVTNVANKQLSNLLTTAINQELRYTSAFAGVIATADNGASSTSIMTLASGDAGAGSSGSVTIKSGTASVNNNSGDITLSTGTVSGTGVRGKIKLVDASLSGSVVGYVWTLQNTSTGVGAWQATGAAINLRRTASSGQSLATNATTIQYPTADYDTNSIYSSNTTSTIPSSGKYYIYSKISVVAPNTGVSTNYMQMKKNGTVISESIYIENYISTGVYTFIIEDTLNLVATDTITVDFFNGFGVSASVVTSDADNVFTLFKVG